MEDDEFDSSLDHDGNCKISFLSQTTKNLLLLNDKLNYWSSKFIVKDEEQYIDVSSAAQGPSSTIPDSASQRIVHYPGTKYQFDNKIFQDTSTSSVLNMIAVEEFFFNMINSADTIDGCKMIRKRSNQRLSPFRKATYTYICSHGMIAREIDDTQFAPNHVGKMNVSLQHNKKHKSKGSLRGEIVH